MMGWVGKRDVRMAEWAAIALIAFGLIAYFHPQQLSVTLYKVSLVTLFAILGFRLDRAIFPYARPDKVDRDERSSAAMRRAILMAAVIIGGTLGV